MQKLKLSRWLSITMVALFAATMVFSSAPALAAIPIAPDGGNPVDDMTIADQAFAFQAYIYMSRNSDFTCAPRFSPDINPEHIGVGNWFRAANTTRSGTLLSPDGHADCNNGNGWIERAIPLWGYESKAAFLCSIGYKQSVNPSVGLSPGCTAWGGGSKDGGLHNDGVSPTSVQQSIKKKFYGGATPGIPLAMRYYIYFENFVVGCGATKGDPWADVPNDERLGNNVYKINLVNPDGTITPTKFTATKGHGDNVTIGETVLENRDEVSCGELAEFLQNNAYANAYAQAVKDNPKNGTVLANVASGDYGTDASEADACGLPAGAMRWLACPVTTALMEFTEFLSDQIEGLLTVPTEQLFSERFKEVWMTFRNVGMVLVIIAALVMIISQALGFEFIDAYTIRKVLPRIALVLIGIALAWPLLQFIVTFFNDMGLWARDLIESPFNKMAAENSKEFNNPGMFINWMILGVGLPAAVIGASLLGAAGVLSLIFTFVLALLIGLFVIAMRQLVIAMAILFAPLALASYILPGTQKLWNFWRQTFITALMMFPIIMAFIAGGKALSIVAKASNQQFLALIVYFAPFFLLPFAFKLAGGLMSTIFSIANDRSRGLFDRGKKYRQETAGRRKGEYATGQRGRGRLGGALQQYAARTSLHDQGGFSASRRGRSQFGAARQKLIQDSIAKKVEDDRSFALGDTAATRAAMYAKDDNDFIERYMKADSSASREQAASALGRVQASIGTIGSAGTRLAAFRGHIADNTAYVREDGTTNYEAIGTDAAGLVRAGILNESDAAAIIKSNQNRPDYSGLGFGDAINLVKDSAAGPINAEQYRYYSDKAYEAMRGSGALFAHTKNAQATAHTVTRRLGESIQGNAIGMSDADREIKQDNEATQLVSAGRFQTKKDALQYVTHRDTQDTVIQEYASLASIQDNEAGATPQAKEYFAKVMLEHQDVGNMNDATQQMLDKIISVRDPNTGQVTKRTSISNQEIMDFLRSDQRFTARRREYGSAADRYASQSAAQQAAAAGAPPAGPAGPGSPPPYGQP